MRVHLSTVRRDGAPIELIEHEDRWEMTFDPCGSGGRALRGDAVEGTPSRLEPPYEFAYIEGAYDWTDGKAGMCVYCNHCQLLYEQWPMDRAGIPFLVVDPPTYPEGVGHDDPQRCRYTIYKSAEAVPDEVYRPLREEAAGTTHPATSARVADQITTEVDSKRPRDGGRADEGRALPRRVLAGHLRDVRLRLRPLRPRGKGPRPRPRACRSSWARSGLQSRRSSRPSAGEGSSGRGTCSSRPTDTRSVRTNKTPPLCSPAFTRASSSATPR